MPTIELNWYILVGVIAIVMSIVIVLVCLLVKNDNLRRDNDVLRRAVKKMKVYIREHDKIDEAGVGHLLNTDLTQTREFVVSKKDQGEISVLQSRLRKNRRRHEA